MIKRLIPVIILLSCIAGCGSPDKPKDLKIYGYSLNRLMDTKATFNGGLNIQQYVTLVKSLPAFRQLKASARSEVVKKVFKLLERLQKEQFYLLFSITTGKTLPDGYIVLLAKKEFKSDIKSFISKIRKSILPGGNFHIKKPKKNILVIISGEKARQNFEINFNKKSEPTFPILNRISLNPEQNTMWITMSMNKFYHEYKKTKFPVPIPSRIALMLNNQSCILFRAGLKMKSEADADSIKQTLELMRIASAQKTSNLSKKQTLGMKLFKNINFEIEKKTCILTLKLSKQLISKLQDASGINR